MFLATPPKAGDSLWPSATRGQERMGRHSDSMDIKESCLLRLPSRELPTPLVGFPLAKHRPCPVMLPTQEPCCHGPSHGKHCLLSLGGASHSPSTTHGLGGMGQLLVFTHLEEPCFHNTTPLQEVPTHPRHGLPLLARTTWGQGRWADSISQETSKSLVLCNSLGTMPPCPCGGHPQAYPYRAQEE